MASQVLNSGTTYKFQLTVTKNAVAWDITTATVTLSFRSPFNVVTTFSAGIDNGPGGVASYTCLVTDLVPLSPTEVWSRSWKVSVGGTVVAQLGPVPFDLALLP